MQLIRFAEEKLVSLLPPKEKKRYLSLNHKTTPAEVAEAENDVLNWNKEVTQKDASLQKLQREERAQIKLPPVRGSNDAKGVGAKESKGASEAKASGVVHSEHGDLFGQLNASQQKKLERLYVELGVAELSEVKRSYKAGQYEMGDALKSYDM